MTASYLARSAPFLFVFIWGTGAIVARLVAPYSEPLTFLLLRYALTIAVLAGIALAVQAPWPATRRSWRDAMLAGMLLHGLYLGGMFWAVSSGVPAGVAALIAGLQPLATGLLVGPLLGEQVSRQRWIGILVGLAGAVLVIAPKLGVVGGLPGGPLLVCVVAMISMTIGTIWQKRTGSVGDLRTSTVVQYVGAAIVTLPVAILVEQGRFDPNLSFGIGLLWAVFGLSIGGVGFLLFLIRRGAVAGVASLFFLVPPVSALIAYVLFGETLSPVQILGMLVAVIGIAITSRG
jgi:drug/metabolite transporter (DMT)-like permease